MNKNLFINPRLQATRTGTADAAREVAVWVDQLSAIVELDVAIDHEAYDLLAHRERLRRVRPELLKAAGASATLQRADQLVSGRGEELAQRALTVPNPQAWLEEAAQLEASYEDLIEPSERAVWAARLLDDLDDAELVLVAAGRLGLEDPELAGELNECTAWLAEHSDVFLPASVYVQGIGQALRPDLDDTDYDLAATVLKFADILRAAEDAERELALEDVVSLPSHVVNGLYARFQEDHRRTETERRFLAAIVLLRVWAQRRPLGRAASVSVPASPLRCLWTSPDRTAFARAIVPAQPANVEEEIPIGFFRASDETLLAAFAERYVRVAGIEQVIQQDGIARISLSQLLEAKEPWRLEMGPTWEEWPLTSAE